MKYGFTVIIEAKVHRARTLLLFFILCIIIFVSNGCCKSMREAIKIQKAANKAASDIKTMVGSKRFLESLKHAPKIVCGNEISAAGLPPTPENFEKVLRLIGKWSRVRDAKDYTKIRCPGIKIEYSGIWSYEYKLKKNPENMSQVEKKKFINLQHLLYKAIRNGIKKNGGTPKISCNNIKEKSANFGFAVELKTITWRLFDKTNPQLLLWDISFESYLCIKGIKKGKIEVKISETKLSK